MRFLAVVCCFFGLAVQLAYAQSANESFTMNLGMFGDNATPTVPTVLSVTPITYSQIDIVWGTSTDNIAIGGYQLYRDGLHIATTTLNAFSDTGLLGSTTYTYTVRAFDISRNYSDLSAGLATTTPPEPPPPPEATSTTPSPTRVPLRLEVLDITTTFKAANIAWETNRYSQFQLRWGRTSAYELGYVASDVFAKEHITTIDNLEPGTRYEYELIGYNQRGDAFILSRDSFTTAPGPDVEAPPNVSFLQATLVDSSVLLSWLNPREADFSHVRVLRSHLFYPADSADGFLVYQGDGETILDQNPFAYSDRVYYSVFSIDEAGNVSSGAIIAVDRYRGIVSIDTVSPPAEGTQTQPEQPLPPLTFADIEFIQKGIMLRVDRLGNVPIDGAANLTIRVPYNRLPEHLKNITVTLLHPDNPEFVFSFLLRINKDKSAYEAVIAPLEASGLYGVRVDIFDFKTEVLHTVTGTLSALYHAPANDWQRAVFGTPLAADRILYISILLILLMMLLLWFLFGRRRQSEEH